jgi:hypothetical protein
MPDESSPPPARSPAGAAPGAGPEADIRERVRQLTAAVLQGERLDPAALEQAVRSLAMPAGEETGPVGPETRQAVAEAVRELDDALVRSANEAHAALERIAAQGAEFGDNDLKEAFARLAELQSVYVRTVTRLSDAASGNLQRELQGLATHVQRVGVDAGARAAGLMAELAQRIGKESRQSSASGLRAAREYGLQASLMASGVLAGIADALREHPGAGPGAPPGGRGER